MNTFSEDVTLSDWRRNNADAFKHLFTCYYPRLMSFVSSLLDEFAAEDIVQDVFLYVWKNRQVLDMEKNFHSYLFQAAYTRSLDYMKKNRHLEKYQKSSIQDYLDEYDSLANQDETVLEQLYVKDFYEQLYELLDRIPAHRREVFLLTYVRGMQTKEIAEWLNIPRRTVESHLYLAVKFLKKRMTKKEFFYLAIAFDSSVLLCL